MIVDIITAIGTVGAVVVSLTVALYGWKKQNSVEMKRQAGSIAAWLSSDHDVAIINNCSTLPIYDVVLSWGATAGAAKQYSTGNKNTVVYSVIPPGAYKASLPEYPGTGMGVRLGVAISFRDCNGNCWRRDARGRLLEIRDSLAANNIELPISNYGEILTPILSLWDETALNKSAQINEK